jgi:hypothetical protein
VAGPANMVAANQPPAAASVSDDSQSEVEFIDVLPTFLLFGRADAS